jgi:hypothetical protein
VKKREVLSPERNIKNGIKIIIIKKNILIIEDKL